MFYVFKETYTSRQGHQSYKIRTNNQCKKGESTYIGTVSRHIWDASKGTTIGGFVYPWGYADNDMMCATFVGRFYFLYDFVVVALSRRSRSVILCKNVTLFNKCLRVIRSLMYVWWRFLNLSAYFFGTRISLRNFASWNVWIYMYGAMWRKGI